MRSIILEASVDGLSGCFSVGIAKLFKLNLILSRIGILNGSKKAGYPQPVVAIHKNIAYKIRGQADSVSRLMFIMNNATGEAVGLVFGELELEQAVSGNSYPQMAVLIFCKGAYGVATGARICPGR